MDNETMDILFAMQDAQFVQINGRLFLSQYTCDPDHMLRDDDIVLEVAAEDAEMELTLNDMRDAQQIGNGAYQLRSGTVMCFLSQPTVH
jgi:hypothetical protein